MNEFPGHETLYSLSQVCLSGGGTTILDSIDLKLFSGKLHLMSGSSGSGKTSLLRLLNGMVTPDSGSVMYRGADLLSYDLPQLRSRVAMITQEPVMFPATVEQNIRIPLSYYANSSVEIDERNMIEMLSGLGLNSGILHKEAGSLSGGEKQRVAIVRAMILRPEVLLADEPTSALDQLSEQKVIELFNRLKGDMTQVVVSHSAGFLEIADKIILISGGRIVKECDSMTPAEFAEFLDEEDAGRNNG